MTNVDTWLQRETSHKQKALENASTHFDDKDSLDVYLLEAIYGQESSFGVGEKGDRGEAGPAGEFQMDRQTANRYGLKTEDDDDQRWDVDDSSDAAARYLSSIDNHFERGTTLVRGSNGDPDTKIHPVSDKDERVNFDLAAYNGGEAAIARAQDACAEDGGDPAKWSEVSNYLEEGGMRPGKANETRAYVQKVQDYRNQFASNPKAKVDKDAKKKKPNKLDKKPAGDTKWITIEGQPVLVEKE